MLTKERMSKLKYAAVILALLTVLVCCLASCGDATPVSIEYVEGSANEGGVYAGGKDKYVVGKLVGNYNCDGTCNGNTVTNMTTSATANIGEIEANKTVNQ